VCSDKEFISQFITSTPTARATIVAKAGEKDIFSATTDRYLKKPTDAWLICSGGGLYWQVEG